MLSIFHGAKMCGRIGTMQYTVPCFVDYFQTFVESLKNKEDKNGKNEAFQGRVADYLCPFSKRKIALFPQNQRHCAWYKAEL